MMKATTEHATVTLRHLLDPLTADEIETASRILRQDRGLAASARFVYVTLQEPAKDVVLRYRRGEAFERQAHIVLRERAECTTYEAVVSITAGEVRLWREVPGVQPAVMLEEFLATEAAVKKDARWQEAMRRRGVTDFDMVMIDPWSAGYNGPEDSAGHGRFIRPLTWVR
jgi:primary-amine oxidase